jgi:hypothetical protein
MTWRSPDAIAFVILALGAFRLTRIIGWDTFAPLVRLRVWASGRTLEGGEVKVTNDRRPEWIDQLLECPWCLGWWVSLATAFSWWAWPTVTLAIALPLALSAVVGLVAKNLDP